MSTEDEIRRLVREMRLIREALERMSPPPPKEPKESAYERRGIIMF